MTEKELQAQIDQVESALAAEKAKGAARDMSVIEKLEVQQADLLKAMDEAKKQAKIEEKAASVDVPFAISGVSFNMFPAELIPALTAFTETVVKADRRRIFAEHAVELEQAEQEAEEAKKAFAEIESKFNDFNDAYNESERTIESQKAQIIQLTTERDEALKLRDNAATQLVEKDLEIDRLKSQIDDYQKAKVFGEREAQNVIETEPEEADEINEALKKLYVSFENYGTINKVVKQDGSFELVKTDELQNQWQQITPPTLFGGSESADSFRNEDPTSDAQDDTVPSPTPPTNVGDTFQTEVQDEHNEMDGNASNGEVLRGTTEERLAALEQKVAVLWKNNMDGYGYKESVPA